MIARNCINIQDDLRNFGLAKFRRKCRREHPWKIKESKIFIMFSDWYIYLRDPLLIKKMTVSLRSYINGLLTHNIPQ